MLARFLPYSSEFDRAVWIRFWGEIIGTAASAMMWPFLMVYLYDRLDTTRAIVGMIVGVAPLAGAIGGIVAGSLTDRWGRRRVIVMALVLEGLFTWGFVWAVDALSFALFAALQHFFGAFYRPAANAMVADVTPPEKRAQAYGLMRIGANAGVAVGPLIGAVVFLWSPPIVFGITGTVLVLVGLAAFFLLPETAPVVKDAVRQETGSNGGGKQYWEIFLRPTIALFVALNVLVTFLFSQFDTSLPLYLKEDLGYSAAAFAFLLSTNAIMVVLFQLPIARRVENAPIGSTLAVASVLYAVGLGGMGLCHSVAALFAMTLIMTAGELIHAPGSMKYLSTIAPPEQRGRYMGLDSLRVLGMMTGPAVGGFLMDSYGPTSPFLVAGAVALVGAAAYLVLGRQIRRAERTGKACATAQA